MGAAGIPLTEIEAWCRLRHIRLTDWELDAILAMDNAVLSVWADTRKTAKKSEKAK